MSGGGGGKPGVEGVSTLPSGWEGNKRRRRRRRPEVTKGPMARKAGINTVWWCGVLSRRLKRFLGIPQGFSWGR